MNLKRKELNFYKLNINYYLTLYNFIIIFFPYYYYFLFKYNFLKKNI